MNLTRCWFSHDLSSAIGMPPGILILRCQDCAYTVPVLQSEMKVDGPQHQPPVIAGEPNTKVRRHVTRTKVAHFRPSDR